MVSAHSFCRLLISIPIEQLRCIPGAFICMYKKLSDRHDAIDCLFPNPPLVPLDSTRPGTTDEVSKGSRRLAAFFVSLGDE